MGCGMKPAKRDEFLGTFAHARTLFRAREIGRSSPLFSRVLRARELSLRAREIFLAHARHDFACAKVNIVQHIYFDFPLLLIWLVTCLYYGLLIIEWHDSLYTINLLEII